MGLGSLLDAPNSPGEQSPAFRFAKSHRLMGLLNKQAAKHKSEVRRLAGRALLGNPPFSASVLAFDSIN
jgi:hypothetical protein